MSDNLLAITEQLRKLIKNAKIGLRRLTDSELCEFADTLEEEAEALRMLGEDL